MLPVWQANTAYVVGTRVTPVTPDGTNWIVETAGTSGNAEPTWPAAAPWTVADGATLVWGKASSFRAQFVSGVMGVLTDFSTANPTQLLGVYASRPRGNATKPTPYAFLASRPETVIHAHDIRIRQMSCQVVLVDVVPDNEEALLRMDALMDGLQDAFTLNFHAAGDFSISAQTATSDIPDDEPGASLYAEAMTISGQLTEGRD